MCLAPDIPHDDLSKPISAESHTPDPNRPMRALTSTPPTVRVRLDGKQLLGVHDTQDAEILVARYWTAQFPDFLQELHSSLQAYLTKSRLTVIPFYREAHIRDIQKLMKRESVALLRVCVGVWVGIQAEEGSATFPGKTLLGWAFLSCRCTRLLHTSPLSAGDPVVFGINKCPCCDSRPAA